MANPATYAVFCSENGEDFLSLEFVVGATGAVGAVTAGNEMKTPVRNGTGDYTFPLKEAWLRCADANAFTVGAFDATKGTRAKMYQDHCATVSAPSVSFQFFRPDTGAAADPATGDIVKVSLRLKRF